jgi:hypothetical protein
MNTDTPMWWRLRCLLHHFGFSSEIIIHQIKMIATNFAISMIWLDFTHSRFLPRGVEKMCGLAFFTYGARDCRGSVTGNRNREKCFHVDLFVVIGKFMLHNEFDLNQKAVNEGRNVVLAPASSPAASRSRQEQVDGLKQGREPCHSGWRGHPLTVDRGDRHAYEYAGNEQGICAQ